MEKKSHHHESIRHLHSKLEKIVRDSQDIFEERPIDGKAGWERLQQGNIRFAEGDMVGFLSHLAKEIYPARRHELLDGQKPFVTVVTCSDSRVSPELIFDEGLGEVFVIRVAGNVLDPISIGSIEYGCDHLGANLLVLMGHQFCGAVTAVVNNPNQIEGNIGAILKEIAPSAQKAKEENLSSPAETLQKAIQNNVLRSKEVLLEHSKVTKKLISEGKLHLITCEYYMDTGIVKAI